MELCEYSTTRGPCGAIIWPIKMDGPKVLAIKQWLATKASCIHEWTYNINESSEF